MPTALKVDTIGPVDVAVILFEENKFNGEVAPALADLAAEGTVRIIDMAFVTKDLDGSTAFIEIEDAEVADAFADVAGAELDLLSDADLMEAAAGLDPGSSAMVIVWENTWAGRLATAIRESHGRVIAMERIPHDRVVEAVAALDEE